MARHGDSSLKLALSHELFSSTSALLKWTNNFETKVFHHYLIIFRNMTTGMEREIVNIPMTSNEFKLPFKLQAGHSYSADLQILKGDGVSSEPYASSNSVFFRAEYTKEDLWKLYEKAETWVRSKNRMRNSVMECLWMYRNKPEEYFQDIFENRQGVMRGYTKDFNGDPASVINGRLKGLFFMANMDPETGYPPLFSPFGLCRLHMVPTSLLRIDTNLYFADFFCYTSVHYVTLVIAMKATEEDNFCEERLIKLNPHQNPFLFLRERDRMCVFVNTNIWVEVLYAGDIFLEAEKRRHGAFIKKIPFRNMQKPAGIPKNNDCTKCNIKDGSSSGDLPVF